MVDYARIRAFYDEHRAEHADDPDFLRGTVERSLGVARFRNRAEARHLARVLPLRPGLRALDLGAGSGRWSLFFAARGAVVTSVELAPSLADSARRNAAARGYAIDVRVGSLLDPPLSAAERFDLVHIGNVLVYIDDRDLSRVLDVVLTHAAAGATLVLREPVDPHGPSELLEASGYHALFRRPERYAELFGDDFRLVYERTSVSHLVPRGRDTRAMLSSLGRSRWRQRLVDRLLPAVGYVDYELLALEEKLRASPLRHLLGDPGVVQHFYVFERGK
jgi:SAM-dependent methyltransferase